MEITERIISEKDLENMKIIKRNPETKKPIVLLNDDTIYKIESTNFVSRLKPFFEILSEIEELNNCIFPKEILYIGLKEVGYTTKYLDGYNDIYKQKRKYKMTLQWKKETIYKIINTIKNLHLNGVIHNDLHGANVLCNGNDIKIIDFDQLKIKGLDSDFIYKAKLKTEIKYLNLLILSILYERNFASIISNEQREFVDELNISKEFKEYLISSIDYKELDIIEELEDYVKGISKKDIAEGKKLVKSLNL